MTRNSLSASGLALLVAGVPAVWAPPSPAAASPLGAAPPTAQESAPPAGPGAPEESKEGATPRRGTRPGDVQKVFVIEHVRPEYLARLLSVFPAEIVAVEPRTGTGGVGARVLSVSAKPAVMAAIEETIKRLDQPTAERPTDTSNVELTGYVLEGLAEPAATESLPSELQGVVDQLRRTFAYPGYRLLDTVVARGRGDGSRCEVSGVTTEKISPLAPSFYSLRAHTTIDPSSRLIRLSDFMFSIEVPVTVTTSPNTQNFQYKRIGLFSNIDIREGQLAVVGKSGLGNTENALVLVLAARVVD